MKKSDNPSQSKQSKTASNAPYIPKKSAQTQPSKPFSMSDSDNMAKSRRIIVKGNNKNDNSKYPPQLNLKKPK